MRTYIVEDIKIEIGAEVVEVRIDDRRIIPQEKKVPGRLQRLALAFWNNTYFKKKGRIHLTVKAAEIATRVIGLHSLVAMARDYVVPYLPIVWERLQQYDWTDIGMRADLGFVVGVLITFIGLTFKSKTIQSKREATT